MKLIDKSLLSSILLGAGVLAQSGVMFSAQAEIYKCTNKQDKVYYNDKPCPVENDEKKIQNEKDPVNGYVPPTVGSKHTIKKNKGVVVGSQSERSFMQLEQEKSADETKPGNDETGMGEGAASGGIKPSVGERKKLPVIKFQDEDAKKTRSRDSKKPVASMVKRNNKNRKLTLKDKKALLGIRGIPE